MNKEYNNLNYGGGFTEEDIKRVSTKKETIEEAADKYLKENNGNKLSVFDSFVLGAKWKSEKMYSEEECYQTLHSLMMEIKLNGLVINDDMDLKNWFNQNKKK